MWPALSLFRRARSEIEDALADLAVALEVRPTAAQAHDDAARALGDTRRYFDQPHAPRAGMSFSQGIATAAPIEGLPPRCAGQRFAR